MDSNWRSVFSQRLADRDEAESRLEDILNSYSSMAKRAINAENQLDQLHSPEEKDRMKALEQQLADKTDTLYTLTKEHDTIQADHTKDKDYIQSLEQDLARYKRALQDYRDEAQKKSNELQAVQDDLLVLQLSLNMAESKTKKLEDENASLVDRWMRKVAEEADKMNDANAFLKSVGKYR